MTMQAGLTVWAWRPRQVGSGQGRAYGCRPCRWHACPSTVDNRAISARRQAGPDPRTRQAQLAATPEPHNYKGKKQWHSHGAVAMPLQKYNYTLMKPCPRYAAKEQTLLVFVLVLTLRTIVSVHHSSVKLVFGLDDIKQLAGRYYGHHLIVIRLLNLL